MAIADALLYQLTQRWPAGLTHSYGDETLDRGEPGSEAYRLAYARFQFNRKVRYGLGRSVWGLDVLELGCGHGGICCYMATAGARSVTGIDLNTANLETARNFANEVRRQLGGERELAVTFLEMRAEATTFADESFDLIVADNLFEHVDDPLAVMKEARRVLRPDGALLVPNFLSIYGRDGLHLKYGFRVPWANLLFSDRTIINTLRRIADGDPRMYDVYPCLRHECTRVRDVRRHRDLNGITYGKFKALARDAGLQLAQFTVESRGYSGKLVMKLPLLNRSMLGDVLSVGASAVLLKPSPCTR